MLPWHCLPRCCPGIISNNVALPLSPVMLPGIVPHNVALAFYPTMLSLCCGHNVALVVHPWLVIVATLWPAVVVYSMTSFIAPLCGPTSGPHWPAMAPGRQACSHHRGMLIPPVDISRNGPPTLIACPRWPLWCSRQIGPKIVSLCAARKYKLR